VRQPCHAALLAFVVLAGCASRKPAAASAEVEKGRQTYVRLCATCHGADGTGYKSDNAPSLRTTTFLASATNLFLSEAIGRGRPGTAMPAYASALGGPLQPPEIEALVAFLREGSPAAVELPAPGRGNVAMGTAIYLSTCVRCHGTRIQRSTAVHLANPVFLQTASDAFLRYAVAEGRLPTSMVAWKNVLNPKQIDDVVAYLRSMAVPPPVPATPPPMPPAAPRTGPVVINRRGRAPDFTLKGGLYVTNDDVKAALDHKQRLVIADARPPSDYLNLHITGAVSTPYYDAKSLDDLPKDGTWIVAYCACPHHLSGVVIEELRKRGYPHTAVLDEGIYAWQAKKYPVVAAPGMQSPPAPPPMAPAPPPAHH
jgi:cytochrome c oxidase cbb3-type subunit 3/ubiquinol-cytochrome c reductase cytochrome c subunit